MFTTDYSKKKENFAAAKPKEEPIPFRRVSGSSIPLAYPLNLILPLK